MAPHTPARMGNTYCAHQVIENQIVKKQEGVDMMEGERGGVVGV